MSFTAPTLGQGNETIRFRGAGSKAAPKLDKDGNAFKPKRWIDRHTGLLVDQVRRSAQPPWTPSLSLAFRMIIFVRFTAAIYTGITDCDEVFNFWEPLHYLAHNHGFQTWELSPSFAIRSWAYVATFLPALETIPQFMGLGKRQQFFCVRIFFAFLGSYVESRFYRAIVLHVNDRVGRYVLFATLFAAGMWNSSTAFLASTTAMHTTMLAWSFYLEPTSASSNRRVYLATVFFAFGAFFAWPFALLLSAPFVVEELFVGGKDIVPASEVGSWRVKRITRFAGAAALASLVAIPIIAVDSHAYGRLTFPALNIILYNLFSSAGPSLYGTEPTSYYFVNLALNFNVLLPLALLSLPALAITYKYDFRRIGSKQRLPVDGETSPYTLVALRLSGFYLWLGVLSAQAHKEERFMYPAYPLLALNAAVTLFLVRGWIERIYIKVTQSPYKGSITHVMGNFTLLVVLASMVLSFLRVMAIQTYYVAPLHVAYHFESFELPAILTGMGYTPIQHNGTNDWDEWDLSPIKTLNGGKGMRLCYGKEWHRYTSSFLVPEGVDVRFVKSDFDGALPAKFRPSEPEKGSRWRRAGTKWETLTLNDQNEETAEHYVDPSTCHYMVDSHYPLRAKAAGASTFEPEYALDGEAWDRLYCSPILDAHHSQRLQRAFWLPGQWWGANGRLNWGEYCLLGNRALVNERSAQ